MFVIDFLSHSEILNFIEGFCWVDEDSFHRTNPFDHNSEELGSMDFEMVTFDVIKGIYIFWNFSTNFETPLYSIKTVIHGLSEVLEVLVGLID